MITPKIYNHNPSESSPKNNPTWYEKRGDKYFKTILHPHGIDSMPMFDEM